MLFQKVSCQLFEATPMAGLPGARQATQAGTLVATGSGEGPPFTLLLEPHIPVSGTSFPSLNPAGIGVLQKHVQELQPIPVTVFVILA